MWPFSRRTEHRQAAYTDGVVAAILARAAGTHADPAATAAVEAAAGALSRAFASAEITPRTPATRGLTPDVLAQIGRALIVHGEHIVLIIAVREGQVLLPPASAWDVAGAADSTTWRYRCDLAGPSGTTTIVRPAESVIHCRYSDRLRRGRGWVSAHSHVPGCRAGSVLNSKRRSATRRAGHERVRAAHSKRRPG